MCLNDRFYRNFTYYIFWMILNSVKIRQVLTALLVLCTVANGYSATYSFKFLDSIVELTDSSDAAPILGRNDSYTHVFSKFDLRSRLGDTTSPTEEDYLLYAAAQLRNWPAKEKEKLKQLFAEIETFIKTQNLDFKLPQTIHLIKTTGKEEFGSQGYTRGNNIMLNGKADDFNTALVAHELFHVFSRYNEPKRNMLYGAFGFRRCEHIDLATPLKNRNITNPDCPVVSHYITVDNEALAIILYSKRDYTGGDVFKEYLQIGLLVLDDKENRKIAKMKDGEPVIRQFSEVPDIARQIGTNTNYALHPEEILAENFAALVTGKKVNEPVYLEKIRTILKI